MAVETPIHHRRGDVVYRRQCKRRPVGAPKHGEVLEVSVAISENGVRPISRPTPSCAWATAFLEAQYRVRPCSQRESPCPAGPSAFRSPIERQTLFLRRTSRQVLLACIQAACDDCESPPQSPARFEWPCPHLPSIIIAIAIIAQEEKKNIAIAIICRNSSTIIAIAIKTALCVCDQHRDLRNRLAADA